MAIWLLNEWLTIFASRLLLRKGRDEIPPRWLSLWVAQKIYNVNRTALLWDLLYANYTLTALSIINSKDLMQTSTWVSGWLLLVAIGAILALYKRIYLMNCLCTWVDEQLFSIWSLEPCSLRTPKKRNKLITPPR